MNYQFLFGLILLAFGSCGKNGVVNNGGQEPVPPAWVNLSVDIEGTPALGQPGGFVFTVVVTGKDGKMPARVDIPADSVNYMRITLKPDSSDVQGVTSWEGTVHVQDTIRLNAIFTPLKTSFIYGYWSGSTYKEFDWKVDVVVDYFIKYSDSTLFPFLTGWPHSSVYTNSVNGEVYTKVHAR